MNIKYKLILMSVFVLFIFKLITAQSGWQRQSPLPTGNYLADVHFISANEGWAVGPAGTIIHTIDGGNSWENVSIDTLDALNSVFFTTPDSGWIVGAGGLIIHTSNRGETWEQQTIATTDNLNSVYFSDSYHGCIVGPFVTNYYTTDGGNTWIDAHQSHEGTMTSVCYSDTANGWAVGDGGTIMKTPDGGITWNMQTSGVSITLYSVCFTDQLNGWAVGEDATILNTNDGGVTWTPQTSATGVTLLTVHFADANTGWAAGYYGTLNYTNDGGQTWTMQSSGVDINKSIYSLYAADQNNVWGIGTAGIIIHTENGGALWNYQRNGTASNLVSVDFIDKNTGWAMTYMGEIVKTTNGGIDWDIQRFGSMTYYYDIFFINSLQGWRVGEPGIIEVTTDGGNSWTDQISGINYTALHSLCFFNADNGWAVGDSSYILKTIDGGNNWTQHYYGDIRLTGVFFADINYGWVVGEFGTILHSSDGGETWISQISNTTEFLRDVYFTNNSHGWAVGDLGTVLFTSNGGISWSSQILGTTQNLWSVDMINKNRGFIAGDSGTVLYTGNGGNSWTIQNTGTLDNFWSLEFADANTGWIVGARGAIFYTEDGGNEPAAILLPSDDKLTFPQIESGDSLDRAFKLFNTGIINLNISSKILSGLDVEDYSLIQGGGVSTISPGDSQEVVIRFRPSGETSKSSWLILTSDAFSSPDSVFLTGNNSIIEIDTIPEIDQDLEIAVAAPQDFTPTLARIFYRQGGTSAWQSEDLQAGATDYMVTIPSYAVTIRGIEYFIRFSDGVTEITYPEINPMENPEFIKTRINNVNPDSVMTAETYKMISFPLNLTEPALDAALEDDYGDYDNTLWRLLKWNGDDGRYEEYPDFGNEISSGEAYWLITRNGESYDVENGSSIPTYEPAVITIHPGWNQIGNPFAFTVSWHNIINSSMVNTPVYWNGNSYEYNIDLLKPWEGYFVYSPQPADFDILVPSEEAALLKKTASGFTGLSKDEFVIQLKVKGIKSGLKDDQNFIGMRSFSKNGFDVFDYPEAPAIIDNINLSIIENDTIYAGNFKSISPEGACWNLRLTSSKKESEIHIDLHLFNELPESFSMYILDLDHKCIIPVNGNKAIVELNNLSKRNLKLIAGKESYVEQHRENIPLVPVRFSLSQNYPNPFNPETTIKYSLAKQCHVKIELYNILGQKIITLLNEEKLTGSHIISWNGKNSKGESVGSGVYFCRIIADDFNLTRKMVLLR